MRPIRAAALLLLAVSGCALRHRADEGVPALEAVSRDLPPASGAIVLTGVELPDPGTVFGGHFGGPSFDIRMFSYQITDAGRARMGMEARRRGELLLRAVGFQVHTLGPSTGNAQQLRGVQYGLSGRVTELAVRSTGQSEPYRVEAQVTMQWELLDLGSGMAVFGRNTRHSLRDNGAVDAIVIRALDESLMRLLADSTFRFALATMRSDPDAGAPPRFMRAIPERGDIITLVEDDLNPANDSTILGRLAAGVVALHSSGNLLGTAFLISRDGLALTSSRAVRNPRRLRARLRNGVERPVRVVRTHRGLDVALIQIACAGDCDTVDWDVPSGVDVNTNVVAVGAPLSQSEGIGVAFGRVGGRWGLANGVTLDVQDGMLTGGEPVARTSSGRVFALVSPRPGRRSAVLLSEVLDALKVRRGT